MIKKTITYAGYNGDEFTEDFYFNLNRAEIMRINFATAGGDLETFVTRIVQESDTQKLWNMFEELVLLSHGEPGIDGKGFPKDEAKTKRFQQSEAFAELMVELLSGENAASNFINGVVGRPITGKAAPKDHQSKAE